MTFPTLRRAAVPQKYLDLVSWLGLLICIATVTGCSGSRVPATPVSITALMWMPAAPNSLDQQILRDFTAKTGIVIRLVPASESASRRLTQEMSLLEHKSPAVDVFQIDAVAPGILGEHLLDLKAALADQWAGELPEAVENATIGGHVIAAPLLIEYGMLYYRTDLLKKYGFAHPPRTWAELEMQSARIQQGERASGKPDFWGYIWQGADYEGLTCNALEWQSSEGGGGILDDNHTVDVDNQATIRAFARAAHWVGTISPPGVTAYLEEDSRNLWQSGRAAFLRNWSYVYAFANRSTEVGGRFAVTSLPAGEDSHSTNTLGGWYLGISKYTRHRAEALAFVRYMAGREVQKRRAIGAGYLPTFASLYQDPAVLSSNPFFASISDMAKRAVKRPSALAGAQYDRVSQAYAHGVHAILTGEVNASKGTANIQAELVRLTGFAPARPPLPNTGERQ